MLGFDGSHGCGAMATSAKACGRPQSRRLNCSIEMASQDLLGKEWGNSCGRRWIEIGPPALAPIRGNVVAIRTILEQLVW